MGEGAVFPYAPSATQAVAIPERPSFGEVAPDSASPANTPGLVLTTLRLEPVYTTSEAIRILAYPAQPPATLGDVHAMLRRLLRADHVMPSSAPVTFLSGRRQYVCRPMMLDSRVSDAQPYLIALLLERRPRDAAPLAEMSRRFRLSPRESETVRHLVHGLTTKEVAQQMSVSPNTVKQFVRLAMSKLGVTTRSGIVGKILGN
jgi:DNA-binding CsgD family transcriptional regulator